MNIENYGYYIIFTLVYLTIAVGVKYLLNFKDKKYFDAEREITKGNLALAIRRGGIQLGLAIAMVGVLSGQSATNFASDLLATLLYGLTAAGFMFSSLLVTDRLVLPGVDNSEEIGEGNLAISFVEFGTLLMTGILAYASIQGDQGGWIEAIVYFVAGQIMLILLVVIYRKLFQARLNPVQRVQEGSLAAGIYLAGKIIAYGLIMQSAISGGSMPETFASAAMEFVITALSGMVLLYFFEYLIDLVIVTTSTVKDILEKDQIVQSVQLALSRIAMALILGMAIL
ncbi:MAG: hypothetical protein CSA50_00175 [Gammaproteobacteria bacterium]|nr:MAG: hypothetical protein CSA50_00175 [Gammaproteobacteria bacterium]